MIIGTAGHIDHGKTMLVRALTGVDTDRLPAEQARGITIELGFAPIILGGVQSSIVDVPGHEAFVRTMVAGAVGIDAALLVVAADDGIRPQTTEHVAILRLLGVTRGVVAITKADRVDAARLAAVMDDVRTLLLVDHPALSAVPILAVSATTGDGVEAIRAALTDIAGTLAARTQDPLVRLPIDRVLSVTGSGTVVTGTLWSGRIAVGDTLRLAGADSTVRVRGVQRHGAEVREGQAGERLAIALANVDREAVIRGDVLFGGDGWQTTSVLRADVHLLATVADELSPRTRVRVHLGTREIGARVVARGGVRAALGVVPVRVVVDEPVVARAEDRFVIRRLSPPATIGGGVVTDAAPDTGRVRPFGRAAASPAERLGELVDDAKLRGVPRAGLAVRLGPIAVAPAEIIAVEDRYVSSAALLAAHEQIRTWLREWHTRFATAPGAPLPLIPELLHVAAAFARAILDRMADVVVERALVRLRTFAPTIDHARDAAQAAVLRDLEQAGIAMPAVKELLAQHGPQTEVLLRQLRTEGAAVLIGQDRWSTPTVVQGVAQRLVQQAVPLRDYTASEIRDMFGVSRKYLIPWLEFCDREGITFRHGDLRRLGARAQRVADGDS